MVVIKIIKWRFSTTTDSLDSDLFSHSAGLVYLRAKVSRKTDEFGYCVPTSSGRYTA